MKQELALQQVFETICQLHLDDKQVSVANVRNKMIIAAPLPLITKAIAAFKADPQTYIDSYQKNIEPAIKLANEPPSSPAANESQSLTQRIEALEHQVLELTKQIAKLSQLT
ncbi:hypothetical protein N7931_10580 [Catenovulum sp. 2E275]|uniref:hypothetical protein n=1 Tax=Catenovulum sp. 2E275 TaxID=2980497 RepID=UPI0021D22FC3|nr:hypothetical protein [Catenovulum sp. 2E275]MCU4676079.1 hypothetical protein [Catenovulum sp. 2E275]